MEVQETRVQTDRVLTIPNILSMARLVGVPLFLWLILRPEFGGPKSDGWALLVLALSGVSDYLDGKLARRWNQISSLGRILDPAADRLYILSTLVGLTWREILPLWLTAVLLARELMLLVMVGILRRHGYPPPAGELPRQGGDLQPDVRLPVAPLSDGSGWLAHTRRYFRMGVRRMGYNALLVGRNPLRGSGPPARQGGRRGRLSSPTWCRAEWPGARTRNPWAIWTGEVGMTVVSSRRTLPT